MNQRTYRVTLSGNELLALQTAAEKRGLHPSVLFERLVCMVINENLIDAVLDDKTESTAQNVVIPEVVRPIEGTV